LCVDVDKIFLFSKKIKPMYKSFSYNGYNIAYQKFGRLKPAVVLVHGFPEDGTVFHEQYDFLQKNHTVIVPDLPGSGKSAYNPTLQSVEDFAEIIKLILQEENIEKCFLLGHSMGGYISLTFARKYPERLLGLGLIHSTAYPDSEEKKENRRRSIEIMEQYGSANFLKTTIGGLFCDEFRENNPSVVEALIKRGKSFETKALQQYYTIMMNRTDSSDVLKNISIPVLFIIGENDKAVPLQDILPQIPLPKKTFVTRLSNAAHMGFLEEPDKVNQAIEDFLSGR
jgi:pimeloyl-ACP methyl ester carboxylesterase